MRCRRVQRRMRCSRASSPDTDSRLRLPAGLQSSFSDISGIRTVPQVFVGGACVGGCDDTLAALRDGTMQQRLNACGFSAAGS